MNKKIITILLIIVIFVALVNVFLITVGKDKTIYIDENTFLENMDISKTERSKIKDVINKMSEEKLNTVVVFKNGEISKEYTYKDLEVSTNNEELEKEINQNYSGNLFNRLKQYYSTKDLKKQHSFKLKFNEEKMKEIIYADFQELEKVGNIKYSLQDTSVEVVIEKSKVLDYSSVINELNNLVLDIYVTTIDVVPEVNTEELTEYFTKNSKKLNQPAKDATISFVGDDITVVDGYNGKTVNVEKSINNIRKYLSQGDYLIPVVFDETPPKVKAEDLKKQLGNIKTKIGSSTTSFASSASGRATNVQIAAKSFNGIVLAPGETLSFNKTIIPITRANGYQTATVFSGGKAVDGLGGGVCQVASTLYNAVLYANLEIVERHNHGLPVGYVKPSLDATVASSSDLDFKFKNNTDGYIYIRTDSANRKLTVDIYGTEKKYDIELVSNVLNYINPTENRILDTTLESGTEKVVNKGSSGYKSEGYRIVKQNGEVIKKEKLSTDTYRATTKEIHYNN